MCLIIRHRDMFHLCGYVQVDDLQDQTIEDLGVDVHGGITFFGKPHDVEGGKWVGFDCAHAFDLAPGMRYVVEFDQIYRTFNYVEQECAKLARQVEDIAQRGRDAP